MILIITIGSILVLTALLFGVRRAYGLALCPACAATLITWVGLLGALASGYAVPLAYPAVLMGASVVGIAGEFEKRFSLGERALSFKALFLPTGFVLAYAVLGASWYLALGAFVVLFGIVSAFRPRNAASKEGSAEAHLKDCC